MQTHTVHFVPDDKTVTIARGETILKAAELAGVFVNSICGGDGLCGKCRVIVREGEVESKSTALLRRDDIRAGYVLACETRVLGDLKVEVPEESRLTAKRAFTGEETNRFAKGSNQHGEHKTYARRPLAEKHFLAMSHPSLDDNLGDLERVNREIASMDSYPVMQTGLAAVRQLGQLLRENDFRVTATLGRRGKTSEVLQFEAGDTSARNYGVAVDIGTTTVVLALVDLNSGDIVSRKATYNSQIRFGEDVITRIFYTIDNPDGLSQLHDLVVSDINNLVDTAVEESGIELADITYMVATGNTTMTHLLLELDVANIRKDPYIPMVNFPPVLRAVEVGVTINGRGLLCTLPGAGPFVGSDITADVISCGMHHKSELALLIDLGTNGEIVLGSSDWLMCCSASAGPAFEGGGLHCGIRATEGAIERVAINSLGKFVCKVIGKTLPKGICGSGVIDLCAELFKVGAIDKSGRFQRDSGFLGIQEGEYGTEIVLIHAADTATGRDITISEEDLAVFIRSKGAIYTAADALLSRMGLEFGDLARVYISGGFGNYVDVGNAILVGLFPDLSIDKFQFIGNGSLNGARMCLESQEALDDVDSVAERMTYVDLCTDPKFMNDFSSSIFLPHTAVEKFPSVMRILKNAASQRQLVGGIHS
ncbi:MAG: ASKHA domain-containing protein [Spirochaetota bacterium]